MRKRSTTIPEEFQEMVEHFARHSNKLTNQTGCEAPMFGGVLNALSDLEDGAPESMVWIVSSSAPNDYKIRKKPLLRRIAVTRAKVYHILTNSTKCKMNLYNEGVNLLRELIVSGGGNQFIVKSKDVGKFMASYIPTLRSSKLISSVPCNNTSTICDVPLTTGGAISKLYITNDNQYGKVDLYDTKGERAPSDEIYNDGRNEITAVEVHETNYVLRINSSVRHHVQVHGTSPIGVTSAFLVNRFGRINLSDDNITHIPYTEENNTVVFHVIGNETDTLLKSVTLHDSQNGNDTTFDLFTRENCTFEYFSGPITCGSNNQVMTVFGLDSEGKPFHRYGGLMCCDLV
ncbi:hypothetical protein AB6A40_007872 [Gnathostoma spinigerum]|uniref:Irg-7-like Ig-like domain-containing protein n=1 Tax=Gnathostoma spinigerum TaxID=75299 RepID=A0ABD6EVT4_9BILA